MLAQQIAYLEKSDKMELLTNRKRRTKETLIKSFVHIAQSDFSSDWANKPQ